MEGNWVKGLLSGFLVICMFISTPVHGVNLSTCADPNGLASLQFVEAASGTDIITFGPEEFPLGTYITNQYANRGIIFDGDDPKIMNDNPYANPTMPVLGTYEFEGDIEGYFVSPDNGTTPMTVSWFSMDVGYFDQTNTVRIQWFDLNNTKLGEAINSIVGVQHFIITGDSIARWSIDRVTTEPAGYAIDNVSFGIPYLLKLTKNDDINEAPNYLTCVVPDDEITYTIHYENPTNQTYYNTYIIDYLPEGVDYNPILSENPLLIDFNYNAEDHSYVWPVGTIAPYDANSVTLTVTVNYKSDPLVPLHNVAELWNDEIRLGDAEEDTPVCPWDMGGIIYVDIHAPAGGNGISWPLAYQDMQDAIGRIRLSDNPNAVFEIRVADGIYSPGDEVEDTFEIPDGTVLYGGYAGYGAPNPDERDWKKHLSILSGNIGNGQRNNTVVSMGDNSWLDGFTVEEANEDGIEGDSAAFTLKYLIVRNNQYRGCNGKNGNISIQWCEIYNNSRQGVWHEGNGYSLVIENCKINKNKQDGIYTNQSILTILNSIIYQNGSSSDAYSSYYGVNLVYPSSQAILRNNTIVYNTLAGIRYLNYSSRPKPQVKNCILFHNNAQGGFADTSGIAAFWHCSLTDPNALDTPKVNPAPDSRGNIYTNPGFAYPDSTLGNFHLAYDSPCINLGDPNETGIDETDIDGESRENGIIDIGADEMNTCNEVPEDICTAADWNADGVVNMDEFTVFSAAWLTYDPNHPNLPNPIDPNQLLHWNAVCDLDTDLDVDLADLDNFCDPNHWLWVACWRIDLQELQTPPSMMMLPGGGESLMPATESAPLKYSVQTDAIQSACEPAPEETADSARQILDFLNTVLEEETPENKDGILEMKAVLEDWLDEVQAEFQ